MIDCALHLQLFIQRTLFVKKVSNSTHGRQLRPPGLSYMVQI